MQFVHQDLFFITFQAGIISKKEFMFSTAEAIKNIQEASKCFEEFGDGYFDRGGE